MSIHRLLHIAEDCRRHFDNLFLFHIHMFHSILLQVPIPNSCLRLIDTWGLTEGNYEALIISLVYHIIMPALYIFGTTRHSLSALYILLLCQRCISHCRSCRYTTFCPALFFIYLIASGVLYIISVCLSVVLYIIVSFVSYHIIPALYHIISYCFNFISYQIVPTLYIALLVSFRLSLRYIL